MRRIAFLSKESMSRFTVALLLMLGITIPLLLALELSAGVLLSALCGTALLALLTALSATKKSRLLLWILVGAAAAVQLFLPSFGFFGAAVEAAKALALYFSSVTVALPLYGTQVGLTVTVLAAVLSFVFAKRGVGFLPAALIVVLVMFGLWSLGKGDLFWYTAPALVALLLMMAQAAHEKINIVNVLPMALTAVLLAFLLLPQNGLTVEPLASAASDLKQKISDYLFFTEPRNVFTLGSYGYYPMGNNQLGGEAEPSEYPVMMVKTEKKTLLRGVVKDEYTGRSFRDTSGAKRYLYVNPRWQDKRRSVFMENLPSEAIQNASHLLDQKAISVQMQNQAASTVFTPLFLRNVTMQSDMVPYFNDSSELFITRDLIQGDSYTVFTPVFEGGDSGLDALVNAASSTADNGYRSIFAQYTQLPDHMEQKVYDDVASIVAGANTPYDKALAIMRHLQRYYRYTLSPETPPENNDFVTYFLYVGKEGYCTYFASAMTVMCRMANLPARYVEGFVASPASDGIAYVTGKDAHAWTEVYFEGFGWVPFDPTPDQQSNQSTNQGGGEDPNPSPSPSPTPEEQPTPTPDANQPDDQPTPEANPDDTPEPHQNSDVQPDAPEDSPINMPWLWIGLALLLAALAARIAMCVPDRVVQRKKTEPDKIFVYGAAVQHLMIYAKRKPKPGETPLAFAKRLDSVHAFSAPISPLWRILTLSNYSRMEPGREQTMRAKETFHRIYRSSHLLRRVRFLFGAAFLPHYYDSLFTPEPHDTPPTSPTALPAGKGAKKKRGGKRKAVAAKGAARGKRDGDAAFRPPNTPQPAPTSEDADDARDEAMLPRDAAPTEELRGGTAAESAPYEAPQQREAPSDASGEATDSPTEATEMRRRATTDEVPTSDDAEPADDADAFETQAVPQTGEPSRLSEGERRRASMRKRRSGR